MSLTNFTVRVDKEQDPKGDRVKLTMSGKFLLQSVVATMQCFAPKLPKAALRSGVPVGL